MCWVCLLLADTLSHTCTRELLREDSVRVRSPPLAMQLDTALSHLSHSAGGYEKLLLLYIQSPRYQNNQAQQAQNRGVQ